MYSNSKNDSRLALIDIAPNIFDDVNVTFPYQHSVITHIAESQSSLEIYASGEWPVLDLANSAFNVPFLFLENGQPWMEANSYLLSLLNNSHYQNRPTDLARKHASKLLDYKLFCETTGLDWLDFGGKRPSQRPTYKYFSHLVVSGERSNAVINQYTGAVYEFYKHVAMYWHDIDIRRVDTVRDIKILIGQSYLLEAQKRSQTKSVPPASSPQIGYVRDAGEDLRPLTNSEYEEFLTILNGKAWSAIERLIFYCALCTGARKQSVLTFRMKHLKAFNKKNLNKDGTYTVFAGPRTGIDTKFDKPQKLYFPDFLADQMLIYSQSELAKERRSKFYDQYGQKYPTLNPIPEDEMYLFLSGQGGCYYMAKNDPRYPFVKTKQTGQVTATLTRKLQEHSSPKFPTDFEYHWLRATYGFQYFQYLKKFVEKGLLTGTDQISFVQKRMHHEHRETTEHYLKLFNSVSDKLIAQDMYENKLFENISLFFGGVDVEQ